MYLDDVIRTHSDDVIKWSDLMRIMTIPDAVIKTVGAKILLKKTELRINPNQIAVI